jgi:glycosyltransferase involved in cell wall biosynthesis
MKRLLRPIRVVIDGSPLIGPKSGVASYTASLIEALGGADPQVEVTVFFDSLRISPADVLRRHHLPPLRAVHLPLPKRVLRRCWALGLLPISVATGQTDVIHSTNYAVYPKGKAKLVIMLHDLFLWDRPELHFRKRLQEMAYHLPRIRTADAVIVSTDYVRSAASSRLQIAPDRLHLVPLGVAEQFHSLGEQRAATNEITMDASLTGLDLPPNYLLFVGTIEPRKNLTTLFKAFSLLPQETRRAFPLLLAGHRGWRTDEIYEAAQPLQREGTVKFLGGVDDALLPRLYAGATIFVFLSLDEGFGLPPLEAMACGTPVIISDAEALVEVSGPAAVVVPRTDVEALEAAMTRLLGDPEERRRMGEAGRRHAAQFTWERAAAQTIEVYRRVTGTS